MTEPSVTIYIVTHKDAYIPKSSILKPIQVGCAIANKRLNDMLHDDSGDNISSKNRMYCELTAQYWAWKNGIKSEYIGFFHYRRYLNFSGKELQADSWGNIIYDTPLNESVLRGLGIDDENLNRVIQQYDIIVPKPRTLPESDKNIYEQYVHGEGQHKEDLDLALKILSEKYPDYAPTAKKYMDSASPYEVNMFIMRSKLFNSYMEWLFDILFEVEKRSDFSSYSQYELRVMGFLSERLFGIWFVHNREKLSLKTLELQKTLFQNTDRTVGQFASKENAVVAVLACNDFYVPYLATMLQSIVQNARQNRPYELYVLTTDISAENQAKLRSLVEIDSRFSFTCVNVWAFVAGRDFFVHAHISVETYYRFYILDLFKETKKVLYLDSDMVVNADIAELYDTDISGCYLAAAKDIDLAGSIKNNSEQAVYVKNDIGCTGADEYFQAGVLLFNLEEMKKKAKADDLFRISQEKNWNYMDQDILNHVYQKKICYLNQAWNCVMDWREPNSSRMAILKNAPFQLYAEYLEARKSPKIIHYAGYQKPWNTVDCDFATYFWKYARQTVFYEEILRRFCEAPYLERINEIEKKMKSRRFLLKWAFGKTLWYRALRKVWRMVKR